MNRLKIIGIGGTNGSGKDTLAQSLVEVYDWMFISLSDILRRELKRRNMPIERKHLRELSAQWRRKNDQGHLIDEAVKKFKKGHIQSNGLVVSSLRNPGEAERVHELGGTVVWVDANPKLRYQRIYSRQRSAEDQKTFEQFMAEEQMEMTHSGDAATLNWQGVKDRADIFITNDSTSLAEFKRSIGKALAGLL